MELKQLKVLFDSGVLVNATVTKTIMAEGFIIVLEAKKNKQYFVTGQRTKGEPRVFKSIDAASKYIADIGFQEAKVCLK